MKVTGQEVRLAASDLANFVACRHLTRLDLLKARGLLDPPEPYDAGLQALIQKGELREAALLEAYRSDGLTVVEIASSTEIDAADETVRAIENHADVIYQGVLLGTQGGANRLLGRPDFLVKAQLFAASDDGRFTPVGYEVVDAKLARTAKARAVLQVAFYSHLLAEIQGAEPRWMHLALGNDEIASFKVADYSAYERQTRRLLSSFVADDSGENPPSDPYPDPVEHCSICRWFTLCASRRRRDDDLSLVAGLTKRQSHALKAFGISSRRGFAAEGEVPDIPRVSRQPLQRIHLQARLQVATEDDGRIHYELLDPERDSEGSLVPNRGLLALPEPATGDLFFDIEGARYYSEDNREFGLQYLFGLVDTADPDPEGRPNYRQFWCFDRKGEKQAFEELIDFIIARRGQYPGLHVYHYNHYEPTSLGNLAEVHETRQQAVGRLMGRFATREDEVDDLFRLGVFVDLYRVVRQGLRAGVEGYSIKNLEPLYGYTRRVDLRAATENLIAFEASLEDRTAHDDSRAQDVIAGYNEDDCRSALALRDWLERCREELRARLGDQIPRPRVEEEAHATEDPEVTRIRSALLNGIPDDEAMRTPADEVKLLVANLVDWHRREAKPGWWRYFHLRTLSDDELVNESDAIGGLRGGELVDTIKRSVIRRFTFPPQDHGFASGDTAFDPATGKGWGVWSLDEETGTIELKIGKDHSGPVPRALIEGGPFDTRSLAGRLRALGDRVASEGLTGDDAATALLLRRRPRSDGLPDGPLRGDAEDATNAAIRLVVNLRDSYLPIQGPPGTGKTFTAAEQVCELVGLGRSVGITGPSHAVIHNLLDAVVAHADQRGLPLRVGQRADEDNPFLHSRATRMSYPEFESALAGGNLDVAAGTIFMWARDQFQSTLDTLFVDEAGQISLANVLTIAGAARNLVLLGDPQQLAQPSQAAHPPGADVSALEHILKERATMPPEAGLLIDRTWRMHPAICSFTSEVFYDGKLGWIDGLEHQALVGDGEYSGAGIRVVEVAHTGNTDDSREEALAVAGIVKGLLGCRWQDHTKTTQEVTGGSILIVTPYNAQVREIEQALSDVGCRGVGVGTVDKFQGREAPIIIYSLATSSADYAPRGMEFLYDLRRLNVAISRARAMAILVASPDLVRVYCKTPRQMRLANALCRAWEPADTHRV